mgnify:FL=1
MRRNARTNAGACTEIRIGGIIIIKNLLNNRSFIPYIPAINAAKQSGDDTITYADLHIASLSGCVASCPDGSNVWCKDGTYAYLSERDTVIVVHGNNPTFHGTPDIQSCCLPCSGSRDESSILPYAALPLSGCFYPCPKPFFSFLPIL